MPSFDIQATLNAATQTPTAKQIPLQQAVTVLQNLTQAAKNEQKEYVEDAFWPRPNVDVTKWDKFCPYQLMVVEAVTRTSKTRSGTANIHYSPYKDWQYTLPLPPESLSISTPFAVSGKVTLDGYIEEHNGAPIRHIVISGTTGFLPIRSSGASRSGTGAKDQLESQVTSIFAGTIETGRSAINSALKAVDSLTGTSPAAYNVYQEAEFNIDAPDSALIKSSGFKQIADLRDFLESYVAVKKQNTDLAKRLRLAFCIWKESQSFLVTPLSFDVNKTAASPLQYNYTLSLRGWKRVELEAGSSVDVSPTPIRHSPNLIAAAINTLTNARRAVQKIGTLKQAVLGDVDYVFKPFHDAILLCKDTAGASLALNDLSASVSQRIKINIADLKRQVPQLWNQLASGQTSKTSASSVSSIDKNAIRGTIFVKDLPDDLTSQIPVSSLYIPNDIKNDILKDLNRVRSLRRKDFEDYVSNVRSTADKVAFLVGAGDPTYGETYGINVLPIKESPTQGDLDTLSSLNNTISILQQFAATADGEPTASSSYLENFGGLAVASGLAWTAPVSKFAIPFPYGSTLEDLASVYLNDPNRSMEIVALNGLRSPYIDEIGYSVALLTDGSNNSVLINQTDDLFVGKTVYLSSNTANRQQFSIEGIKTVNGTSIIQLNDTVNTYKAQDNAVLEAFLTGTVCSRNLIWIPSDIEPSDPESVITKDIPNINVNDPMVSVGGVDLMLGSDLDLLISNDDLLYTSGLSNIVQWVRFILSVEQGELKQHKEIGIPLSIGLSLADFNAKDVVTAIKKMLGQDSTFSRIDKIVVKQNGPAATIDISALVAGTSKPLPLNYGMKLN